MRERLSDYQEKYGDLYNLEATPAESTSYRLAKHDVEKYPDIITASESSDVPYYTNSSHLPVGYTDDIFSALDIQDELQTLYTSGTVFHAFLGEKLPDWKAAANLVRKIAENYKLPYYTMSPTYSVCKKHGYISGEHFTCPTCGEETEVYSRITGYYRPVRNWNAGKTQEYKERKEYKIDCESLDSVGGNAKVSAPVEEAAKANTDLADGSYLFASPTCPNCKLAYSYLEKAEYPYTKIMATENVELTNALGIKQAPTLVVVKNGEIEKFAGFGAIKQAIEK
jgi:ribonucleoside-triphosphate reductase